jgi:hypothetical protein
MPSTSASGWTASRKASGSSRWEEHPALTLNAGVVAGAVEG